MSNHHKKSGVDYMEDNDPDSSVLPVVPFQGHPFIIMTGESYMGCKFGKNMWAESTRKKQEKKRVCVQWWIQYFRPDGQNFLGWVVEEDIMIQICGEYPSKKKKKKKKKKE